MNITLKKQAIIHPTGQLSHIPFEPNKLLNKYANATRNKRSVNVDIINLPIKREPLKTPSAINLIATIK